MRPALWHEMVAMELIEPGSLSEALASDEKEKWEIAWQSEFNSLEANKTWETTHLPLDETQ